MSELDEILKDYTQQNFAYLIAENAKRPQEPSRILTMHFVQISHIDDHQKLCYNVEYNDGTIENVPIACDHEFKQTIIDHNNVMQYYCHDCRKNVMKNVPYDIYMVTDELWKEHGAGDHCLCFHCFQLRTERELVAEDFPHHDLNSMNRLVKQLKAKVK